MFSSDLFDFINNHCYTRRAIKTNFDKMILLVFY